MSYEIYKHRDNTVRNYDRWIYSLVGKGEHEGTILAMPQERIFMHRFGSEREMAAWLDREFLLAHGDRIARIEAGTDETPQAAQPEGREPDQLQTPQPIKEG